MMKLYVSALRNCSRRNMEKRDGNSGFKLTLYAVDGMDTFRDGFECMISRLWCRLK